MTTSHEYTGQRFIAQVTLRSSDPRLYGWTSRAIWADTRDDAIGWCQAQKAEWGSRWLDSVVIDRSIQTTVPGGWKTSPTVWSEKRPRARKSKPAPKPAAPCDPGTCSNCATDRADVADPDRRAQP